MFPVIRWLLCLGYGESLLLPVLSRLSVAEPAIEPFFMNSEIFFALVTTPAV